MTKPDGAEDDGEEAQPQLTIRTTLQGDQIDLVFNAWLTEQVADLLESHSVS